MELSLDNNIIIDINPASLTPELIQNVYENCTLEEQRLLDALIRTSPPKALMPHQIVPIEQDWWEYAILVGGRGVGKTVWGAYEARSHLWRFGKDARIGIGAPTISDARDTCMEGQTGLIKMFPNEWLSYNRSLGEAYHINGGFVKAMGTEKPERWNGPQWSMLWFDELALCNQAAWDDANMGLRIPGPNNERPYAVCSTTPKNRKWVKLICQEKTTYVPQYINDDGSRRLPTTFDNIYLPDRRVAYLKRKYGGTRLGRQELEGMFLDDIEGAQWKRDWFLYRNDPDQLPRMVKVYVAIDPAGSRSRATADENALTEEQRQNQQKNADTAIAVVGLGEDGKFYVLDIYSDQYSPSEWGILAIKLYHQWRADMIIAEINFGGAMVEHTIRSVDVRDKETGMRLVGRYLPMDLVTASRGKDIRAQPVAMLYEQRRVFHHAARAVEFAALEDQMCAFIDAEDNEGADMVDAVVWGISKLGGLDTEYYSDVILLPGDPRMSMITIIK